MGGRTLSRDFTLEPGVEMSIAGSTRDDPVPNGFIRGIGFHKGATQVAGGSIRIRNIRIL